MDVGSAVGTLGILAEKKGRDKLTLCDRFYFAISGFALVTPLQLYLLCRDYPLKLFSRLPATKFHSTFVVVLFYFLNTFRKFRIHLWHFNYIPYDLEGGL